MAEKKSYIYEIVVDTQKGTASINGTAIALDKLEGKMRQVQREAVKTSKNMGQVTDKTGLAGAAVVELGRTISDSNYGLTAMANNISQLSTLMVTLIATTGGVKRGFQAMWTAIKGPLGIILVFQIIVMLMEKWAMGTKSVNQQLEAGINLLDAQLALNKELIKTSETQFDKDSELYAIRKRLLEQKLLELEISKQALENEVEMMIIESQRLTFMESMRGKKAGIDAEEQSAIDALDAKISGLNLTILKTKNLLADGLLGIKDTSDKGRKGKAAKKAHALTADEIAAFEWEALMAEMEVEAKRLEMKQDLSDAELEMTQWLNKKLAEEQEKKRKSDEKADQLALEAKLTMLDAIGGGMQSLGYLIGKETQAGKAVAAAGALIDTYAAITKTLSAFAGKPIPGYAIAQAVATGLFGFAQVKKIYEVNVPNGGGGGAGSGAVPSDVPIQQPDFNIVGVTRGNQIRDTIQSALGKPIRAYVTTKDIRSGEELDRNIVRGATVG